MVRRSGEEKGYRSARDMARQPKNRRPRPIVLIICEGSKTERNYFEDLCHSMNIIPNVKIDGECDTHPLGIVEYATRLRNVALKAREPYESVWCVFDRDEHAGIKEAIATAKARGLGVAFSNPCIEIWFLLHFRYSSRQIKSAGAKHELQNYIPGYTEATHVYETLKSHQAMAVGCLEKLRKHHKAVGNYKYENPSTTVDGLVKSLEDLAEKQCQSGC